MWIETTNYGARENVICGRYKSGSTPNVLFLLVTLGYQVFCCFAQLIF